MSSQHLPGEEVWAVGEHSVIGERKYCLSNLPADTPLKQLAGAILRQKWQTQRQVKTAFFQYLNGFFNTRRHSQLGGISPVDFDAEVT